MRRALTILLSLGVFAIAVVSFLFASFSAEIRDELLLRVSPELFRRAVFVKLENSKHEQIYLLGTIHDRHLTTASYSLTQIESVVLRLRPGLLLVESRPEELARDNWADGPIEMPVASLTARSAQVGVKGFDWWVADNTHQIDSDERERRMFQNIRDALPDKHSVLILTGFSHVETFRQELTSIGYSSAPFSSAEKDALFAPVSDRFVFPHGMARYLQRRIALDRASSQTETDPFWKSRMDDAIEARLKLLKIVASTGEQRS